MSSLIIITLAKNHQGNSHKWIIHFYTYKSLFRICANILINCNTHNYYERKFLNNISRCAFY